VTRTIRQFPVAKSFQVSVNPNRSFEESSFDNDVTTVPVRIP
jgi:hypothetical protein